MSILSVFIQAAVPLLLFGVVLAALMRHSTVSNYVVRVEADDCVFGTSYAAQLPPMWKLYFTYSPLKKLKR